MKRNKRHLYKLQALNRGSWRDIMVDGTPLRFYDKDTAIKVEHRIVREFKFESRIVPTTYLVETMRNVPGYVECAPQFCPLSNDVQE